MSEYETELSVVVKNDNKNGITFRNSEWGEFFVSKIGGCGFISWDSPRRKKLKPGNIINVSRQKRGDSYVYKMVITSPDQDKIIEFLEKTEQNVVVTGCAQFRSKFLRKNKTKVQCYSPVWKDFEFVTNRIDINRGDKLKVSRTEKKRNPGKYNYYVTENYDVNEIVKNTGINEVFKYTSIEHRGQIMDLAHEIMLATKTK